MEKLTIQPDTLENKFLIFFTDSDALVKDGEVNAKIKRVVLSVLWWIIAVITLGTIAACCADKRWHIERGMRVDAVGSQKTAITAVMDQNLHGKMDHTLLERITEGLNKIDGLSKQTKRYIISLIPVEIKDTHTITKTEGKDIQARLMSEVNRRVFNEKNVLSAIDKYPEMTPEERQDLYRFDVSVFAWEVL